MKLLLKTGYMPYLKIAGDIYGLVHPMGWFVSIIQRMNIQDSKVYPRISIV